MSGTAACGGEITNVHFDCMSLEVVGQIELGDKKEKWSLQLEGIEVAQYIAERSGLDALSASQYLFLTLDARIGGAIEAAVNELLLELAEAVSVDCLH